MTPPDPTPGLWRAFDEAWYRHAYPIVDDLIAAGQCKTPADAYAALAGPLAHAPNPYFSESWYRARYKAVDDAVKAGLFRSGFDHFCQHGWSDLMPHWLFDPTCYRRQFRQAAGRNLDASLDGDPYEHFLLVGQHRGLTGHPLFDPNVYTAMAAYDLRSRIGRYGPFTTLLFHIGTGAPEPTVSNLFDPAWYRARYPSVGAEIAEQKWCCALHHYLANGDPADFDPSPRFSERLYVAAWPDVAVAIRNGDFRNGFAHFLLHGRDEQRFFAPAEIADPAGDASPAVTERVTAGFPLTTRSFDEVTLLPCRPDPDDPENTIFGVLGPDREIIPAFSHSWMTMQTSDAAAEQKPGSFIYGGVLTSHFGHVLRDGLASLWYIRRRPELPVLWHWLDLPVSHQVWPTWLDEMWQILGLDRHSHHFVRSPVTVDRIVLPDLGLMAPNVLHQAQARALGVRQPAGPWEGNRIWLSRSALPGQFGRIEGETDVEAVLAARGWTVLHPEARPVAAQVDVFATAAVVAGSLGSAFHAVLLSTSPRARLILVDRPGIEHTFYDAVAEALELRQVYLSPELEPFTECHPWATFRLADPRALADAVCVAADSLARS